MCGVAGYSWFQCALPMKEDRASTLAFPDSDTQRELKARVGRAVDSLEVSTKAAGAECGSPRSTLNCYHAATQGKHSTYATGRSKTNKCMPVAYARWIHTQHTVSSPFSLHPRLFSSGVSSFAWLWYTFFMLLVCVRNKFSTC